MCCKKGKAPLHLLLFLCKAIEDPDSLPEVRHVASIVVVLNRLMCGRISCILLRTGACYT